ncbi:MAG TPA: SH3 domain-containing protein, partial [Phormidium sp.]
MKTVAHWGKPVALLSVLLLGVGSLNAPASAVSKTAPSNLTQDADPSSLQLAQATQNLCRRVNVRQGLAVRERPDPNARQTGGVGFNTQVTLAEGARSIPGPDGRLWVEITSPVR